MAGLLPVLVVVTVVGVAAVFAVMLPQAQSWPYAQRRFALRGHRSLRE